MNCARLIPRLAAITGILVLSSALALGQTAPSRSEPGSGRSTAPQQSMGPGMIGGPGMMGGSAVIGPGMMGGGPGTFGPGGTGGAWMMGPEMMGGTGGMMGMPMMGMMMSDPKTRGQMMEIEGQAMKEMGELMVKRQQGK